MSVNRDELKKAIKEALAEERAEAEKVKAKPGKAEKVKIEPDSTELPASEEIGDKELKEIVASLEGKPTGEKYECPNYPEKCDYVADAPFDTCPKCGAGPISWD
jgi:rubrerythrin